MRRVGRVFLFLFVAIAGASGQSYFDYNNDISQAYTYTLQLKMDSAQHILDNLKMSTPDNLATYHIENYIDFFTVFLGEEKEDFEHFEKRKTDRLNVIKQKEIDSPFWRLSQAEITLQYALVRSKFGEYLRAGWDVNRANKLLKKNQSIYPDFKLNYKSLSVIHSLMGSLKGIKRSLVQLFTSMDGDYAQGIREIEELYHAAESDQYIFTHEITAIRALISMHVEKNSELAHNIINNEEIKALQSPTLDFVRYSVSKNYDQSTDQKDEILRRAIANGGNLSFDYLWLLLGTEYLQQGDTQAEQYLRQFIDNFNGRHYIKEAYQKMAWYELIMNDDVTAYKSWMAKLLHVGNTTIGEDQQAHRDAQSAVIPDKDLLQARLYYDGSRYPAALNLLDKVDIDKLSTKNQLEYYYRKARVLQGLFRYTEATELYKQVISIGASSDRYFACSAALQLGIISSIQGAYDEASVFFIRCLSLDPEEHQESLHQKARSWQQRIKGRQSKD